jgi:16S rRNA (uracil1498-N3)-methyltransferase
MIRLFVRGDLTADAEVELPADQAHYLTRVMRRAARDEVLLFNGRDGEWRAVVTEAGKRRCRLRLEDLVRSQRPGPDLDLVVALVKRPRLETIVEKAAELGARRIRLVVTEHTNADRANVDRLGLIATEAAEQTGRLDTPEIFPPRALHAVLGALEPGRRLMFCDEAGEAPPASQALAGLAGGPWAVLIGPEGGFSPAERVATRARADAIPVALGPRILRADTAAIAALALWQSALGDWRGT